MNRDELFETARRAGKRALIHLIQAAIEGVKAVEAVIDEIANMRQNDDDSDRPGRTERIEVE
ncbi:MAG TPA: hypothetical protein VIW94_09460 [Acidimicrobiia bacterium]